MLCNILVVCKDVEKDIKCLLVLWRSGKIRISLTDVSPGRLGRRIKLNTVDLQMLQFGFVEAVNRVADDGVGICES